MAPQIADRVRHLPLHLRHALRRLNSGRRLLPSYVIVGAQKAGTTFLHNVLSGHPEIAVPTVKEINYFSVYHARPVSWYQAHFPLPKGERISGESSTNYLPNPWAAERMARLLPDAKIIVLLREPASRAWSHYQMNVAEGRESLSFADAIEREDERLKGETERMERDPTYRFWPFRLYSYRLRGRYLEQILRFEERYPKEKILVMDSGRLFRDTTGALLEIERFIGVSEWMPNEFKPENVAKGKARPDTDVVCALKSYFKPYNEALFDHLGMEPLW